MAGKQKTTATTNAIDLAALDLDEYWGPLRKQLRERHDSLSYGFGRTAIAGISTIEAIHRDWDRPIAVVWFRHIVKDCIEVLDSLTFAKMRRCGLRTFLHEKLLAEYPLTRAVFSQQGTPDGAAWMAATGYNETAIGWQFRVKKGRPK